MYALAQIICHEFEKNVGKDNAEAKKALHVGFSMYEKDGDQYRVVHMYIFAPYNYVYVAIQEERIDADGERIVAPMEILSYHDSCWREAVREWISKNQREISVLKAYGTIDGWNDVLVLTDDEVCYLHDLNRSLRDVWTIAPVNPFDNRGFWAPKEEKKVSEAPKGKEKELKIANIRDWEGRGGHLYVAGYNKKDMIELLNLSYRKANHLENRQDVAPFSAYEFNTYASIGAWGNLMAGIKVERGVWKADSFHCKPYRLV